MVTRKKFASKPEWLLARKGKIGGSDAAAVLGLNPYKNNVEFWNEMVGITKPRDISNEPYVIYGSRAEEHIRAIFECKTSELFGSMHKEKWDGEHIPDNYYIQVLHYLMVTEYEFVELRAQIKSVWNKSIRLITKDYHIERADVEEDIEIIKRSEREFMELVKKRKKPALILPEI